MFPHATRFGHARGVKRQTHGVSIFEQPGARIACASGGELCTNVCNTTVLSMRCEAIMVSPIISLARIAHGSETRVRERTSSDSARSYSPQPLVTYPLELSA